MSGKIGEENQRNERGKIERKRKNDIKRVEENEINGREKRRGERKVEIKKG